MLRCLSHGLISKSHWTGRRITDGSISKIPHSNLIQKGTISLPSFKEEHKLHVNTTNQLLGALRECSLVLIYINSVRSSLSGCANCVESEESGLWERVLICLAQLVLLP